MPSDTTTRAFRIAYDGRPYHGFQRQPDQPTVEGAILDAFASLEISMDSGPGYAAAGRTDAGVSALAQTIRIHCPEWLDAAALNGALPPTIVAWAQADVDDAFHPQYDAISRQYSYVHYAPDGDVDLMRAAGRTLVGTHDFRHLTPDQEDTVRTVSSVEIEYMNPFLLITVEAPGFVRHQVRRMVTVLDEIARGVRTMDELREILSGKPLPGHRGIRPAESTALVLEDVTYEGVVFSPHPGEQQRARERFHEASVEQARISRVMQSIANGIE